MKLDISGVNDLRRHIAPLQAQLADVSNRVIANGWFVLGPEVKAFEASFAAYCNVTHCVGVANGTDALELSLRALGIGAGKTVATVANAGMYSTSAILASGARPLYVDIDPVSQLMSPTALDEAIRRHRPNAIIITHLYGSMANMPDLMVVAKNHSKLPIVEDCAQAHGATIDGQKAGSFGDLAAFSFYPTKNLGALGDGGAVVARSDSLAAKVRHLRQYGWTERYKAVERGGRNSRLDELQAAFLSVLLPNLDGWNRRRREIAVTYSTRIKAEHVTLPATANPGDVSHLYVVRVDDRDSLRSHLTRSGIPSDVHFPTPDYCQPAVKPELLAPVSLPETERSCASVLSIPCFPELSDDEVAFIVDAINAW